MIRTPTDAERIDPFALGRETASDLKWIGHQILGFFLPRATAARLEIERRERLDA